jgi:DNA-binding MarR family transcriptional regulator
VAGPPTRPGGKLGLIVDRLATDAGASADELAEITGWRKNSVLGALSRLRMRGFALRLETTDDRRAYRLARPEA